MGRAHSPNDEYSKAYSLLVESQKKIDPGRMTKM
jgi:hypothetical protein